MSSAIYAKIGSHYDQEIAGCTQWIIAQFIKNGGTVIDEISDRINATAEQAEEDGDQTAKYLTDFARLGLLAALSSLGTRYNESNG
jgi:hypothetical protein